MNTAGYFYKKSLQQPELAQVSFVAAVLERYLGQSGVTVRLTNTVGRVKTSTWSLDFGIAPDEQSIHATIGALQRLPETEQNHWLEHVEAATFSENFLKMQGSHACIDVGDIRIWVEERFL
jgi:hypothetical protein